MTGDCFCVKCKSHHVADALNGKYDNKVLIFFFNFSSKLQGLPCAENIGLLQYFLGQYVAALSSMTLFHHPRYLSHSFLKIPSYSINTDQHLLPAF